MPKRLSPLVFSLFAMLASVTAATAGSGAPQIGIDEHIGKFVPLSLTFNDENGKPVTLKQIVAGRPMLMSINYYECPGICTPQLQGIAEVIDRVNLKPGKDFEAISISFDPKEGPSLARSKKANMLPIIHRPFEASSWHFLTGDTKNIAKLCKAVGFQYEPHGKNFTHAAFLAVMSGNGRLVRYLYGTSYLPVEVETAVKEAAEDMAVPTLRQPLYCFSYDPAGRAYLVATTRIGLAAVLLGVLGFILYLRYGGSPKDTASKHKG